MDTNTNKTPEAVELKSADNKAVAAGAGEVDPKNIHDIVPNKPITPKRTLHLSMRATVIGLVIVVVLVGVNLAAVVIILRTRSKTAKTDQSGYSTAELSVDEINKLGGKSATIGESYGTLIVAPLSTFKSSVQIDKGASVGGKLNVIGASTLTGLTAASTTLSDLTVGGKSTLNTGSFKSDVVIGGTTTMQGGASVANLLTVTGALNVIGSASISGSLTVSTINFKNATLNGTLTINGHYVSGGPSPSISYNTSTLGVSGTASISGNDTSGTIVVNPGTGTCAPTVGVDPNSCGLIAQITFGGGYTGQPHIVLSPIGREAGTLQYYVTRTATGFKLYTASTVTPPSVSIPAPQIGFDYFISQ